MSRTPNAAPNVLESTQRVPGLRTAVKSAPCKCGNPWCLGVRYLGDKPIHPQYIDPSSRIRALQHFNLDELRLGLCVYGVQSTVVHALLARIHQIQMAESH